MKFPATIYVVDDDPAVLKALAQLLRASNFTVEAFESSKEFLRHYDRTRPSCVICDLAMPGFDGLALQRKLLARGGLSPVIFLSGHNSVPGSVQAMKLGAVDFLTKPANEAVILKSVRAAMEKLATMRAVRARLACLTSREKEVLKLIADGQLNKQMAGSCGVTERTVKFHRANLVRKLGAKSTADLIHLAIQGGLTHIGSPTSAAEE
ncbi:MAG: hypothetical protein JWM35_1341 [Verrucomicrobia bacterium]|nr:hypothetical protein [Verrucomicrobiota bacterium]